VLSCGREQTFIHLFRDRVIEKAREHNIGAPNDLF
jgi:hypothetical protein